MGRQRNSPRSVVLSDDSSRRLLRTHFANARFISTAEDTETGESTTTVAPRKKAAPQLATAFCCPSCKRADSVECRTDLRGKVAEASCWACGASNSTSANTLTEPVDVYSEWMDKRRCAKNGVDGDVMMCDA